MHPLLAELNPQQRAAAETTTGPVLILAGAGSGKTKALTHRVAYLVAGHHVRPMNILAVTFTNKAAAEMRGRVLGLLNLDPANRSYFPFIGTFHSICLRLLRREATEIGLATNFLIFDTADSQSAIKRAMRHAGIDDKQFTPSLIHGLISSAKNELVDHRQYAKLASGKAQAAAAKVYPLYQGILQEAGALDFDDLIFRTVQMFRAYPDILAKYQQQFQYIMVDEYQDTNHAQYQITKLLAAAHHNICVVGDDWQCLPPETVIETSAGPKPIAAIRAGELVRSAAGYGKTGFFPVQATKSFDYQGQIIHIRTASGKQLRCTPNHVLFSRWDQTDKHFVYLMYSSAQGYRIGVTQGTRFDGKRHDIGLRVRANQERADCMWILGVHDSRSAALHQEALLAYQYGLPMLVFRASANPGMHLGQEQIDDIYRRIDTRSRAQQIMRDFDLHPHYPHFIPQATTRNGIAKMNINVVLFGDKRVTSRSPWSASRISANTTHASSLSFFETVGYAVRAGRAGTFRSEIHNLDYAAIEQSLERLQATYEGQHQINKYAFISRIRMQFMPAGQIHPGMLVPVQNHGDGGQSPASIRAVVLSK